MYTPENLEKWTLPDSYAGPEYPEYFVFLGRHGDSDLLAESNFEKGLEKIGGESETVLVIRDRHWAVGWIETIYIHETDENALRIADEISEDLKDYPVVDEDDWRERESNEADRVWKDNYNVQERIKYIRQNDSQFDFDNYADLIGCIRGEYFKGCVSELIRD